MHLFGVFVSIKHINQGQNILTGTVIKNYFAGALGPKGLETLL